MQEVLVLVGIPGSGKSTYAKQLINLDRTFRRLNKDDLRNSLGYVEYDNSSFKELNDMTRAMLKTLLNQGFNVVVDNTNLQLASIKLLQNAAEDHDKPVKFVIKIIDTPLELAIMQNNSRASHERVPEEVIRHMHKSFQSIKSRLPKDPIVFMPPELVVVNNRLPKAVICDLDGTLADTSWRNPYDAGKADRDPPHQAVLNVVKKFQPDHKILFVSGREDKYREQTVTFLENNVNEPYELFMRKTGDMRRDTQVKFEIFDQHIRDRYNIKFVMDDRDCCCILWRKLGLKTFQVAPGDF